MATLAAPDLSSVSRTLGLNADGVRAVIELLDAGNTVPFITRYRKDQTGGLDEEQIRAIQERVVKLRALHERKQTILRSIESQGKLTPELAAAIEAAATSRGLEDLYLTFKPKKQTLGAIARERGLEPLAQEILTADPAASDLDARALDFVNPDRKVSSAADALLGAGHILAESFSERADLRGKIREIFSSGGKLVTTRIEPEKSEAAAKSAAAPNPVPAEETGATSVAAESPVESGPPEAPASSEAPIANSAANTPLVESIPVSEDVPTAPELETQAPTMTSESPVELVILASDSSIEAPPVAAEGEANPAIAPAESSSAPSESSSVPSGSSVAPSAKREKTKKKPEKKAGPDHRAFRDYFQYSEPLSRVPPHRVLAINRGERAKAIRVKVEVDLDAIWQVVDELLAPVAHPHVEFLRGCAKDAMQRLVLPSLEREFRRELTDRAESHAVDVFARNLRKLLLQPPIRDRRVLAVDPGYKSGCKLAALDEFGKLLDHGVAHIVGSAERRAESTRKVVELIKAHNINCVAIGNGTACRETEQWISDLIAGELAGQTVAYVVVNEAGASVYSTSRLGREEFPTYDATLRGAISIGRRLQDPLSELVKIDAANIGVGMYQHDVKAKHLQESLDAVVASCVNYVGVDLNSASSALLRYVSGLNQLTAQRVFDFRVAHGPFKSREQLKSVPGIGDATFVQAAGFLKIVGGDNPLDVTWIHPESYLAAEQVLARLEHTPATLADKELAGKLAEKAAQADLPKLAAEVSVGVHTLADMLAQLARPGRDPRDTLPPPIFRHGILKIDDLAPGMHLQGTILNVVDFGAFVDIGLKDSGLVHISQLADKFVADPHSVVSVGDIVRVWVMEVDKERRRVSLTMVEPGSRKPPESRRPAKNNEGGPAGGDRGPRERRPPRRPAGAPRTTAAAASGEAAQGQEAVGANQDGQGATREQGFPARRQGQRAGGQRAGGQGSGQRSAGPPSGGRPAQGGRQGGRPPRQGADGPPKVPLPLPKPKPKPVVPITKAMREGRAPMRTFGDLQQFFALRQEPEQPPPSEETPS